MKENIKLVFHLAKPELKISWSSFIGLFLFYTLFTILFITGLDAQQDRFAGFDLFFIMLFVYSPTWFRPTGIQYQKISGNTWGAPPIVMGLNLPIPSELIAWKSIFVYFLSSFPFQLYMFIMLYLINPEIREMMEPSSYIAFVLIWLSFGIYAGFGSIPVDLTNLKANTFKSIISTILVILFIILIIFFPFFFPHGIVEWTIILASKWSIASILISALLAIVGLFFWKDKMTKQLRRIDYL